MTMSRMEICNWDTSRSQQRIRVPAEGESRFGIATGLKEKTVVTSLPVALS